MNNLIEGGYNNNPNLVKANIERHYTKEQILEIDKCIDDPIYFAKTYMKIVNLDHGLIPFVMRDYQEKLIQNFFTNRFNIAKLPRQCGKTTTYTAFLLHKILFNDDYNIAILANKGATAREILAKLQLAYEHLPKWLQQGIKVWNKGSIELENGSKIKADATSGSSVRGSAFNCIVLDEFAFVPNNEAEAFFASVYPTISSGKNTQVIIVSTPKGMNHFWDMWEKAEKKKNLYVPFSVAWNDIPGRDEAFREETRRNVGELLWDQEYECNFLGSSQTLISGQRLRRLITEMRVPINSDDHLDIYEHPVEEKISITGKLTQPGHVYVITVDVSRGQGLDASAFSVIDVTELPYVQVAKYRCNDISPMLFPTKIYNAAKYYNDAFILVEINDIGQQIAEILHFELEYDNLVKVTVKPRMGQTVSTGYTKKVQYGIKSSTGTKRIGCSNLKTLIEQDRLLIYDSQTIMELSTFTAQKDSYAAEEGQNDDLAITLTLFAWLISQRIFRESLTHDVRKTIQKELAHISEEDTVPFGVIDSLNYTSDPWEDDDELQRAEDMFLRERFPDDKISSSDKRERPEQRTQFVLDNEKFSQYSQKIHNPEEDGNEENLDFLQGHKFKS